jgi:hypothetical protein
LARTEPDHPGRKHLGWRYEPGALRGFASFALLLVVRELPLGKLVALLCVQCHLFKLRSAYAASPGIAGIEDFHIAPPQSITALFEFNPFRARHTRILSLQTKRGRKERCVGGEAASGKGEALLSGGSMKSLVRSSGGSGKSDVSTVTLRRAGAIRS